MVQRLNLPLLSLVLYIYIFNFVVGKASPVMIQNSEDLKKRTYIKNHIKTKIHVEKPTSFKWPITHWEYLDKL